MEQSHIDLIDKWCETLEEKANKGVLSNDKIYFWFKVNKKYTKIVKVDGWDQNDSIHAFIDNNSLDIYKPANWNVPYKKYKKYNLLKNFNQLLHDCEWTGGYLYKTGIKKVKKYVCK